MCNEEEEGVWIEVDADDPQVDLSASMLVELMGEKEARGLLEAQGMDPDDLMESFGADDLSELDQVGISGEVTRKMSGPSFSSINLQTAVELSAQVSAHEVVPPERGDRIGWGLVIGSITSCMSFLDAIINEFIDDVSGSNLPFHAETADVIVDAGFDNQFRQRLERLEGEIINWRHTSTLQKYQTILIVADEEPFDSGAQPFQDVNTVRRLRNYFVHYQPEMYEYDKEEVNHSLGSALQGKFDLNPNAEEREPFFPNKTLSHGCTEWTIETVIEFTDEFFDRFDLIPDYRRRDNFDFGNKVT